METPASSTSAVAGPSAKHIWIGRILLAIPILFLAFDGIGKVLQPVEVVEGTMRLGYAVKSIIVIGILELGSLLLFCIPRTSILGALFLTAFLGGAVATHIRIGDPLFSHILFPTYIAILLWSGLLMLDLRLRTLLPFRSPLTDRHR
jgi:hypothetical protein